jgi:predicted DNA-binding transcriptional regulator YafY
MVDPTWWWQDTLTLSFWEELQQAVYEDHLIEGRYENFNGEVALRVLAPYSLICKSSLWYLLAEREGELRTYRVSRFHSIRLLGQSFTRRPDFDLPAYWQTQLQNFATTFSEYQCILKVHPERMVFIKALVPGRWEVLGEADARGWISIRLLLDTEVMAKMLVFGLTGFVEVLSPPELTSALIAQARGLLADLKGVG